MDDNGPLSNPVDIGDTLTWDARYIDFAQFDAPVVTKFYFLDTR